MLRRLKAPVLVVLLAFMLGSCYLPARFDMEIELDRRGYYKMTFAGYMVDVRIYSELKSGKIKPGVEGEGSEVAAVKKLKADIERDPNVTDFGYIRKGYFKIDWKREGDLLQAKQVVFLRRNEHVVGLSYNKNTYLVNILGRSLPKSQKDQLVEAGLNMTGELRVITDTKVVSHNADAVKDFPSRSPRTKVYVFRIPNIYRATPRMQISLR